MFDTQKVRSTELYATLAQASKDVMAIREWLYGSKDRINEHILEHFEAFEVAVSEALQNYKSLSEEKLTYLKELYKKVVFPFDYTGDDAPLEPKLNEIWLKNSEAKIFKYIINPNITFFQKERPKEREIGDIWFKPSENDANVGEFYLCEEVLENEAWINPALPQSLEPAFESEEEPKDAKLGDIWKKTSTNEYFVFIKTTSGDTWANPENPSIYTPTFESENEPENAKLGDIWKKGEEYFIYARISDATAWILKEDLGLKPYIWQSHTDALYAKDAFLLDLVDYTFKENEERKEKIANLSEEIKTLESEINALKEQIEQNQGQDTAALETEKTQKETQLSTKQTELKALNENHLLTSRAFVNARLNALKAEVDKLVKTKENVGIAKSLTDALRTELTRQISTSASSFRVEKRDLVATYDSKTWKITSISNLPSGVNMQTYLSKCAFSNLPETTSGKNYSRSASHLVFYLNNQYVGSTNYVSVAYAPPPPSTNNNN